MNRLNIELNNQRVNKMGSEALIDFYRCLAIDKLQRNEVNAFVTGIDDAFLNVVIESETTKDISLDTVEIMSKFFQTHQLPWSWFITSLSQSHTVLEHQGFVLLEEYPNLYRDLLAPLPELKNPSIEIKAADNDLLLWVEVLREGFASKDGCEKYRKLNTDLKQNDKQHFKHYIAYYQGEIASCATLFLSINAVMLHNLATKTKFRKLGIGSELTLHLLFQAKKLGYKSCFLDSSADAFNLYHRLGFRVYNTTSTYSKIL